jgi:hypothetical protein
VCWCWFPLNCILACGRVDYQSTRVAKRTYFSKPTLLHATFEPRNINANCVTDTGVRGNSNGSSSTPRWCLIRFPIQTSEYGRSNCKKEPIKWIFLSYHRTPYTKDGKPMRMRDGKGRCLCQDNWVVPCCHQLYAKKTYFSLECPLSRTLSMSRRKRIYTCINVARLLTYGLALHDTTNATMNHVFLQMVCVPGVCVCVCVCKYVKLFFYYYFSRFLVPSLQIVELKKLPLLWKKSWDSKQNTETRLHARQRRHYLSNPGRSKRPN